MIRVCDFDDPFIGIPGAMAEDKQPRRCGLVFNDIFYSIVCPHRPVGGNTPDLEYKKPLTREEWDREND